MDTLVTVTIQPSGNPSTWGLSIHVTKKSPGPRASRWCRKLVSHEHQDVNIMSSGDNVTPESMGVSGSHRPRLGYWSNSTMHSTTHYRAWHVPRHHLLEAEKHAASTEATVTQLRAPWSLRTFPQMGWGWGCPEASGAQEMVVWPLPVLISHMPGLTKGCEHSDLEG